MEAAKNGVNDVYGYTQINPTFTPTLKKYLLRWLETHIDINIYFNRLNAKKNLCVRRGDGARGRTRNEIMYRVIVYFQKINPIFNPT